MTTSIYSDEAPLPLGVIEYGDLLSLGTPVVDWVPKTSAGKFDKKVLRGRFKDWQPSA